VGEVVGERNNPHATDLIVRCSGDKQRLVTVTMIVNSTDDSVSLLLLCKPCLCVGVARVCCASVLSRAGADTVLCRPLPLP
jgi:hypothetical protein